MAEYTFDYEVYNGLSQATDKERRQGEVTGAGTQGQARMYAAAYLDSLYPGEDGWILHALTVTKVAEDAGYILCRHTGNSFFYYHPSCAPVAAGVYNHYRRVSLEDMGIGATCMGCMQTITIA